MHEATDLRLENVFDSQPFFLTEGGVAGNGDPFFAAIVDADGGWCPMSREMVELMAQWIARLLEAPHDV